MKMNKFFAAVAAAALSVSAFAAMSSTSASAASALGKADIEGSVGSVQSWDMTNTVTNIDGDAQYEVVWDFAEATNTGSNPFFCTVVIAPADGVDNFATATFPDLKVTLDEVYVDGTKLTGYDASAAVDTNYYEGGKAGVTRIYLRGDWAGNATKILGNDLDVTSQIKVLFTVEGTGQQGTSNVVAETSSTTTITTSAAAGNSNSSTTTTTTAAAGGTTTAGSTTTPAPTGDLGVGAAVSVLTLAGVAAYIARKKD